MVISLNSLPRCLKSRNCKLAPHQLHYEWVVMVCSEDDKWNPTYADLNRLAIARIVVGVGAASIPVECIATSDPIDQERLVLTYGHQGVRRWERSGQSCNRTRHYRRRSSRVLAERCCSCYRTPALERSSNGWETPNLYPGQIADAEAARSATAATVERSVLANMIE